MSVCHFKSDLWDKHNLEAQQQSETGQQPQVILDVGGGLQEQGEDERSAFQQQTWTREYGGKGNRAV